MTTGNVEEGCQRDKQLIDNMKTGYIEDGKPGSL
jgi:hypothetical protein